MLGCPVQKSAQPDQKREVGSEYLARYSNRLPNFRSIQFLTKSASMAKIGDYVDCLAQRAASSIKWQGALTLFWPIPGPPGRRIFAPLPTEKGALLGRLTLKICSGGQDTALEQIQQSFARMRMLLQDTHRDDGSWTSSYRHANFSALACSGIKPNKKFNALTFLHAFIFRNVYLDS